MLLKSTTCACRKRREGEPDDALPEVPEEDTEEEALLAHVTMAQVAGGAPPPLCPVVRSQLETIFGSYHDDSNT